MEDPSDLRCGTLWLSYLLSCSEPILNLEYARAANVTSIQDYALWGLCIYDVCWRGKGRTRRCCGGNAPCYSPPTTIPMGELEKLLWCPKCRITQPKATLDYSHRSMILPEIEVRKYVSLSTTKQQKLPIVRTLSRNLLHIFLTTAFTT